MSDAGRAAGARYVDLEVRGGNGLAIALYESEGFVQGGRRAAYYVDTGEDALLMRRPLQ